MKQVLNKSDNIVGIVKTIHDYAEEENSHLTLQSKNSKVKQKTVFQVLYFLLQTQIKGLLEKAVHLKSKSPLYSHLVKNLLYIRYLFAFHGDSDD